ncbi:MAG: hypothetical protein ABWY04_00320 [Arthrobacter sp.]
MAGRPEKPGDLGWLIASVPVLALGFFSPVTRIELDKDTGTNALLLTLRGT